MLLLRRDMKERGWGPGEVRAKFREVVDKVGGQAQQVSARQHGRCLGSSAGIWERVGEGRGGGEVDGVVAGGGLPHSVSAESSASFGSSLSAAWT